MSLGSLTSEEKSFRRLPVTLTVYSSYDATDTIRYYGRSEVGTNWQRTKVSLGLDKCAI